MGSDPHQLNKNFRGDSPWSVVRARVFAQRWLTEKAGFFAEAIHSRISLFDDGGNAAKFALAASSAL